MSRFCEWGEEIRESLPGYRQHGGGIQDERGDLYLLRRGREIIVGLGGSSIWVRADLCQVRKLRRVVELGVRGTKGVWPEQRVDGHSRRVRVYNCCVNMSSVREHGGGGCLVLMLVKYVESLDCTHGCCYIASSIFIYLVSFQPEERRL